MCIIHVLTVNVAGMLFAVEFQAVKEVLPYGVETTGN